MPSVHLRSYNLSGFVHRCFLCLEGLACSRGIEYSIAVFTAGSTKLLGESGHRPSRGTVDRILKGEKAADLPVQAPTWSSQLSLHCYMSSNFAPRPKSPGGQYSPPAAAELDASPRLF